MKIAPCRPISSAWPRRFARAILIPKPKRYERPTCCPRASRQRNNLQGLATGGCAPDADEQPRSGGGGESRQADRLWRHGTSGTELGSFRRDCAIASRFGERRNLARPIRKTDRYFPHARGSPAGPDRELQSRRALVELRGIQPARTAGAHHVWANDGRIVDLYRQPGNRAGDV